MGHTVYIPRVILRLCDISLCSRLSFSNIKKCMEWTLWEEGGEGFRITSIGGYLNFFDLSMPPKRTIEFLAN